MNYTSFCDYLFAALSSQLDSDATITKETIRKNNNVYLDAFIIRFPGGSSAPVVYLEPLYQSYKDGSSIDKIARMIAARLTVELPLSLELVHTAKNLDSIRDKIAFRLISRTNNQELLADIPWIPFLDLAIIFFIHFGVREDKQITSVICNQQARSWNVSPEDLYALALKNTPCIYPAILDRMEHVLLRWEAEDEQLAPCKPIIPPLYLLSNETGIHGAGCLLYPNILKDFAEKIGSDLIILPSSIHEVLLLADDHTQDYALFRDMVCYVNAEDVPKEDILSDELYLYRLSSSDIIMWSPCDSDNAETCGTENQ